MNYANSVVHAIVHPLDVMPVAVLVVVSLRARDRVSEKKQCAKSGECDPFDQNYLQFAELYIIGAASRVPFENLFHTVKTEEFELNAEEIAFVIDAILRRMCSDSEGMHEAVIGTLYDMFFEYSPTEQMIISGSK